MFFNGVVVVDDDVSRGHGLGFRVGLLVVFLLGFCSPCVVYLEIQLLLFLL